MESRDMEHGERVPSAQKHHGTPDGHVKGGRQQLGAVASEFKRCHKGYNAKHEVHRNQVKRARDKANAGLCPKRVQSQSTTCITEKVKRQGQGRAYR